MSSDISLTWQCWLELTDFLLYSLNATTIVLYIETILISWISQLKLNIALRRLPQSDLEGCDLFLPARIVRQFIVTCISTSDNDFSMYDDNLFIVRIKVLVSNILKTRPITSLRGNAAHCFLVNMMMVLAVHLYVVIHCGPAITKDLIGPMMPDCTYFGPIPDFMAPLVGLDIFCRFSWTTEGNLKK